jgi:hypothetical protein
VKPLKREGEIKKESLEVDESDFDTEHYARMQHPVKN